MVSPSLEATGRAPLPRVITGVALALALACGDDPPPVSEPDDSTDSGAPTPGGATSTGPGPVTPGASTPPVPPPTTSDDGATTFGAGCGPDPCPRQCGPECEVTATCIASEWICECDCPMTGTDGDDCASLDEVVDAWVALSKTPAVDCGAVGPKGDLTAWQTVHDCVIAHAVGTAFTASWTQPDGEDPVEYGTAARAGVFYELAWFERSGDASIVEFACERLEAIPDCSVDVGLMCLRCEGQAQTAVRCEET